MWQWRRVILHWCWLSSYVQNRHQNLFLSEGCVKVAKNKPCLKISKKENNKKLCFFYSLKFISFESQIYWKILEKSKTWWYTAVYQKCKVCLSSHYKSGEGKMGEFAKRLLIVTFYYFILSLSWLSIRREFCITRVCISNSMIQVFCW